MADVNVYLRIETIPGYSPVAPEPMAVPPKQYARDCMRNPGHEDGTIPLSEVNARKVDALIYREYLDPFYMIPKPDKIVLADINEPAFSHRVPGTVIYAFPGDRLHIHVRNADSVPHSLHVHGLIYGIDSDGSWPFGTQSTDNRRSDEICPGQRWTYVFDVTQDMIGAWPFHDHSRRLAESINRGLFGGIVVLPRARRFLPPILELPPIVRAILKDPPIRVPFDDILPVPQPAPGPDPAPMPGPMPGPMPMLAAMPAARMATRGSLDAAVAQIEAARMFLEEWAHLSYIQPIVRPDAALHVPIFIHSLSQARSTPMFDKNPFNPGMQPFEVTFGAEGTFSYHCEYHSPMHGKVIVAMGGNPDAAVTIVEGFPPKFEPAEVTIRPGGKVRWFAGQQTHSVTEDGAGLPTFCINGRAFVGNTPTIVAHTGQRIRWYVFNLDLGTMWHNFHPHGQRWRFANEPIDIRSIGPAESFVVETTAPPAMLLPPAIASKQTPRARPKAARPYRLRGDFLFHCHVESHMMQGLSGLVRAQQTAWLTAAQAKALAEERGLPVDPGGNACPSVDLDRCDKLGCGEWVEVPGVPQVTFMHAALVPKTSKVLFFGYGDNRDDQSRLWDYSVPPGTYSVPANQPFDATAPGPSRRALANLWSTEHAYEQDGTLLVHGGFTPRQSYSFDGGTLTWTLRKPTHDDRFYSTTLTLKDGKLITLYGSSSKTLEVYDPNSDTWSPPKPLPFVDYVFYPWTYLLPGGDLFIAGHQAVTRRFDWTANPIVDNPSRRWVSNGGDRSSTNERGTSVVLPLRPPNYEPRVMIMGGDTPATRQSAEVIDLSVASPAWATLPTPLNEARPIQVNSVLLPDGRVFLAGGIEGSGGPAEIFDPSNPGLGWLRCASMKYSRGYHSAAILLADGSVLMGGDSPPALSRTGETTPHERYFPSYYYAARPTITNAPPGVTYGANFTINTPDAAAIGEVVLLRPGAVTHGFNMSQRFVGCSILSHTATTLQVKAPPDGTVAPSGYYLLFMVNGIRIPSLGRWIQIS